MSGTVTGAVTDQQQADIIVVGSANLDYLVTVPAPPGPGETVLAGGLRRQPGGKGANQAVAAARLGGAVRFVGAVGDDGDGAQIVRGLRDEGIDVTDLEVVSAGTTGIALVSVFGSGENSITVVPGTNFALTTDRVQGVIDRVAAASRSTIVVAQAEVLPEIISATVTAAARAGARVVLNLAPYQPVAADVLAVCDPLVLNEAEAGALLGRDVVGADAARRAVRELCDRSRSVVITAGAEGAAWADADGDGHVPAPAVAEVVDTTGAGDAFVGALVARLARGAALADAVGLGVAAGSYAVLRPGAQSSYATPADLGLEDQLIQG